MTSKRFLILDRDGTIVAEKNYLSAPDEVELLPGAAEGLRRFRALGWGSVIVSNQSGIGRGYFDLAAVDAVHGRLRELLIAAGATVDAIYICPHAPEEECGCRKPRTGLVLRAAADLGFEPAASIVIGDKDVDIELARALGVPAILVRTGYGSQHLRDGRARPDFAVSNLLEAAELAASRWPAPAQ